MDSKMDLDGIDIRLFGKETENHVNLPTYPYESDKHNCKSKRRLNYRSHFLEPFRSKKLRSAASFNDLDSVQRILKDGTASANSADEQGRTALHIAASRGYAKVVEMLIKGGADPNLEDKLGNTPLHLAIYTGSIETVSHLLAGGCYPRRTKKLPSSPLDLARSKYVLLHRAKGCTAAKYQVFEIIQLIEGALESILTTEDKRRREVDSVLKGLSSLNLTNPSPPESPNRH